MARSRTTARAKMPMAVEGGRPISRHTSVKSRLRSSSMLMVMAIARPIPFNRHVLNTYYITIRYIPCRVPIPAWQLPATSTPP